MKIKNRLIKDVAGLAGRYGASAFLVGGAVRDALLKRNLVDLDFTFDRDPSGVAGEFAKKNCASVVEHRKFFTYALKLKNGVEIDFAAFRKEAYPLPACLPEVSPGSLIEDLFRRDFTVNAVSLSLANGKLVDPFEGVRDLNKGVLKVMHCGSFIDDPTRIFRLARFLARFGFRMDISTRISLDSARKRGTVSRLSPVRIKHEFESIFKEKNPGASLGWLHKQNILKFVHPMLGYDSKMRFPGRKYGFLNAAVLLQNWDAGSVCEFLENLQVCSKDKKKIVDVVTTAQKLKKRELVPVKILKDVDFGLLSFMEGADLKDIKLLRRKLRTGGVVTGSDLKRMGFKPGPKFREIFLFLSQAVDEGKVNSKRDAEKLIFDNFSHQR